MFRWIFAAVAILVLSLAISAANLHALSGGDPQPPPDAAVDPRNSWDLEQYEAVSLVRLLADPERYHQRKVRVEGFVAIGADSGALYLDKDQFEGGVMRNALAFRLARPRTPAEQLRLTRRYGEIAGVFDGTDNGPYGFYSGVLNDTRHFGPTVTAQDLANIKLRISGGLLQKHVLSGWVLTLMGWTGLGIVWLLRRARR